MLSVSIHLHGNIVIVLVRIDISGLYGTANPHVNRQIQILEVLPFTEFQGRVRGAVIDHQIIILGRCLHHMVNHLHDILRLVVGWYDHQNFSLFIYHHCISSFFFRNFFFKNPRTRTLHSCLKSR